LNGTESIDADAFATTVCRATAFKASARIGLADTVITHHLVATSGVGGTLVETEAVYTDLARTALGVG